jgi:hypothetical protein
MSELRNKINCLIPVDLDRFINHNQQHPSVLQIQILKDQLRQEKLKDKEFYQSIKQKIATN